MRALLIAIGFAVISLQALAERPIIELPYEQSRVLACDQSYRLAHWIMGVAGGSSVKLPEFLDANPDMLQRPDARLRETLANAVKNVEQLVSAGINHERLAMPEVRAVYINACLRGSA